MKMTGAEAADRRGVFIGLAALATGVLWSSRGRALPSGWSQAFRDASAALLPVGVGVSGRESPDLVAFSVQPLAATEYRHSVNLVGSSLLGIQTAVRDDVASFTHFYDDGESPIPCAKTTILGDGYATYELYDHSPVPCVKLESELLEGGYVGAIELVVEDLGVDLRIRVGNREYVLFEDELVEVPDP